MCGILCLLWNNCEEDEYLSDYVKCKCTIDRRGPDCSAERAEQLPYNWRARFVASVLWMQGSKPVQQPCVDTDGNILLWNGDIFSGRLADEEASDTRTLLDVLQNSDNFAETLKSVRGPYSVVYYHARRRLLYFARDPIGRHSLLLRLSPNSKGLTLSSSANRNLDGAIELPAIGIFVFDLETSTIGLYPWRITESGFDSSIEDLQNRLGGELAIFDAISREEREPSRAEPEVHGIAYIDDIMSSVATGENDDSKTGTENSIVTRPKTVENVMKRLSARPEVRERMQRVLKLLRRSIKLRVEKKPDYCKKCARRALDGEETLCGHAKLGILFSGGLDSTIIAALADEFVDREESIDLVNVAFERARRMDREALKNNSREINDPAVNFDVPDRKTGRQALNELREICPWRRWNFVECNVTREELQIHRSTRIRDLVYPLSTILDDSLGCALWFAGRGSGTLSSTEKPYVSPCRVLLLGMGADELFGGYTRHRTTLRRGGWTALRDELDAELARISGRNLGRDDRIVADHGRQSRLPYLDEDFVEYVSGLEAWERCCPTERMPAGIGDKLLLRLVARDIGLRRTANFPKRAFQFGSRIANGRENAKDASNWMVRSRAQRPRFPKRSQIGLNFVEHMLVVEIRGYEFRKFSSVDELQEHIQSDVEFSPRVRGRPVDSQQTVEYLPGSYPHQVSRNSSVLVLELRAMSYPLPDLRPRDLGGRGILDEAIVREVSPAVQPVKHEEHPDADVVSQTGGGHTALRQAEKIFLSDFGVGIARRGVDPIPRGTAVLDPELVHRLHEAKIVNHETVQSHLDFGQFRVVDRSQNSSTVSGIIVAGGQKIRRHAARSVSSPPVTNLHDETHVTAEKSSARVDVFLSIGKQKVFIVGAKFTDYGSGIVPDTAVEPQRVFSELPEYIVHLEGREDILDENASSDRTSRKFQSILAPREDVVPQSRLLGTLELGEIETRACASFLEDSTTIVKHE